MVTNHSSPIGQPISRIDGPRKVTGSAPYAAEYDEVGLLHGYVLASTIASGEILSIDTGEAFQLPGVVEIFTHENRTTTAWWDRKWRDQAAPPGHPFRPLQSERILFDGQPIALVVAQTLEEARDAASLIKVHYKQDVPETDFLLQQGKSYVPSEKRSGTAPPKARGKPEEAYENAACKISADYALEAEHHNPMELFATTVMWENKTQLTVYDKTQGSQNVRDYICGVFGLKADDVRVVNAFVGGGFGSGLRPQHQVFMAVMASLFLERSVRVELTRRDMFYLSHRPAVHQTVSLAADEEGRLQSVMHRAVGSTSRYEDFQENVVAWSGLAYACENAKMEYEIAQMDIPTPGDMRAPGAATGIFALECAMDELAHETGLDPLELRRINFVHFDQNGDKQLTSKALHDCYSKGAEQFGWQNRTMAPRSMRSGRDLVGWGMATGLWGARLMPAKAKVRFSGNGQVHVSAAASDIGTGTYTILAQIAAAAFDLAIDQVQVEIGDSSLSTNGPEGGSAMAASTGSAVDAACQSIREKMLKLAQKDKNSVLKDATAGQVVVRQGRLVLETDETIGVAISELLQGEDASSLEAEGSVGPDMVQALRFSSNTHSAVFVEVKVDEDLGTARVTRIVSAIAAGRILNPKTARSQIIGGMVMGLGMALHEEGLFDHRSGRLMNPNFAEYHIPAHADIADLQVIFVEENDDRVSPLGIKGVGEIGLVGVASAIANAIFHATGKRVRHLPITVDKILAQGNVKDAA